MLKVQIQIAMCSYFSFLFVTSSKYLLVIEVRPIAVVRQANATIIPKIIDFIGIPSAAFFNSLTPFSPH